jgi:hypothetical protein
MPGAGLVISGRIAWRNGRSIRLDAEGKKELIRKLLFLFPFIGAYDVIALRALRARRRLLITKNAMATIGAAMAAVISG